MKPILLLALISVVLAFGCTCKPEENILPLTNPFLGEWEYTSGTITKRYEFTDTQLVYTREASDGNLIVYKGDYAREADGSIIFHHITEATENGTPKPQWIKDLYYQTKFLGTDTLRLMDYFYKYTRLSGNPDELNNSSFYRYTKNVNGSDTSYTHFKGVFENDSVKSFVAYSDSPAFPENWSSLGGQPVLIYPDYYTNTEPFYVEIAYLLSGQDIYIGPWIPQAKFVKKK